MVGEQVGGGEVVETPDVTPVLAGAVPSLAPQDVGVFKADTVVTRGNIEAFLRAAGLVESSPVPGWLESVAFAANVTEKGISASKACDALKAAGSREMAQKLRAVLNRESV